MFILLPQLLIFTSVPVGVCICNTSYLLFLAYSLYMCNQICNFSGWNCRTEMAIAYWYHDWVLLVGGLYVCSYTCLFCSRLAYISTHPRFSYCCVSSPLVVSMVTRINDLESMFTCIIINALKLQVSVSFDRSIFLHKSVIIAYKERVSKQLDPKPVWMI